ncbi:MAG: protoporphyrinogen/coproporphyrinogen oxidase [Paludibacteraceae bacterium]
MKKIAIIGAGVSGLTAAQLLKDKARVVVFEKESTAGGLIRCERVNGGLFHTCGGHVFNTKMQNVLDWFWQQFNRENEFVKTDRNSVIFLPNGQHIPYPIENFAYMLDEQTQKSFIQDLLSIANSAGVTIDNFQAFLRTRFGDTLYKLYFEPYNKKVWRCELSEVPIDWLEGKLPMPTVEEMIYNNFNRVAEKSFVHSTFYYEKQDGSQLIANRLAEGLDIRYNAPIEKIERVDEYWKINEEMFDKVVFCGNIKDIPLIVEGVELKGYSIHIEELQYHGTTSVFCEIDKNPYSWIYLPDNKYRAHRIICTGNFAQSNNGILSNGRVNATVEFTDEVKTEEIIENLQRIPLHPVYITHKYNQYTYPIQNKDTRDMIASLKQELAQKGFYMTGRFADWEYYNMDTAMNAAMITMEHLKL